MPVVFSMSEAAWLYECDFCACTQDRAALLRAWPEALRPNALDLNHLAEEIEDSGEFQRRAARSLLLHVIQHLLKLRLHPDRQAERRWKKEVNGFRDQLRDVFAENPSFRAARTELAGDPFGPVQRDPCGGTWTSISSIARR